MKRCLVVGAGDCGPEVLSWALQMQQNEWEVAGFLDANPDALKGRNIPWKILGDPATWEPAPSDVFIAAIGTPGSRVRVCDSLRSRGAAFISVMHPSVVLGMNAEIGEGCVISPNVVVSAHAKLGRFVHVNIGASIGHDSTTGDGTTISCHCDLMGHVTVGRECFLGSHACILPGKRVGDFAMVGAGSAVVRNVRPNTTVMGVPAEVVFKSD